MLTQKQLDLLEFIQKRLSKNGVPPSFDEMKEALDLRSKSGIHRLITALEERGFIKRLANRARAIEIVKMPNSPEFQNNTKSDIYSSTITPFSANSSSAPIESVNANEIPVMGRIDGHRRHWGRWNRNFKYFNKRCYCSCKCGNQS